MTDDRENESQPTPGPNLYQRVNEVRKTVGYIRKQKEVDVGERYKVVTHDEVTAALRNSLIEHGIIVLPPDLVTSAIEAVGETKYGKTIWRYSATYEVAFVNEDDPNDRLSVRVEAHANDTGDKAPGKAVSYATKVVLLKLFLVETGENEESRVEPIGGWPTITEKQVEEVESLIAESKADRAKFLLWAGVDEVGQIRAKDYDNVCGVLRSKFADTVKAEAKK